MITQKTLKNMLANLNREDVAEYQLSAHSPGDGFTRYELGVKVQDGHFHTINEGMSNKEAYEVIRSHTLVAALRNMGNLP